MFIKYDIDGEVVLVCATSKGMLYGWNLSRDEETFKVKNPVHHGNLVDDKLMDQRSVTGLRLY
jgi:hypothetical protein